MIRLTLHRTANALPNRAAVFALVAAAVAAPAPALGQAGPYPAKPVRIIVPTAPGGGVDILSRLMGQKLGEVMGQPFIIDNRGGAGGNLGIALAAKAPADGYTLLMVPSAISISAALYPALQYDAQKDLAPIALVASTPYFSAAASFTAREFPEGARGLRAGATGAAELRVSRRGKRIASGGGDVQAHRRSRSRARAVQGDRPGHDEPDRGTRLAHGGRLSAIGAAR
jgi:hypothetical protein